MNDASDKLRACFKRLSHTVSDERLSEMINDIMEIYTEMVGIFISRQLADCECPPCRNQTIKAAAGASRVLDQAIKRSIDKHLKEQGINPIFGQTDHNESVTREILHEIEAENKG